MKPRLQEGDVHIGYGEVHGPLQPHGKVTRGAMIEGDTYNEFSYNGPAEKLKTVLGIMAREAVKQGIKVHSNNADRS